MFQSTRPRGARPKLAAQQMAFQVSIHAPTWGATTTLGIDFCYSSLNPRAHVGRDPGRTLMPGLF